MKTPTQAASITDARPSSPKISGIAKRTERQFESRKHLVYHDARQ